MSGKSARTKHKATAPSAPQKRIDERSRLPRIARMSLLLGVAVVLGLYFASSRHRGSKAASAGGPGAYPYSVGSPGRGKPAPPLNLPATTGGSFDLTSYRGKQRVLLYFQEGLTCQPCWDQIATIQKDRAKFSSLGIGPIVSITTDRLDLIRQKANDDGLSIPVLSDEGGRVSDTYDARSYGMMGHDRDGHTFVLVGKDGRILWRADYGGAPKYTMFVPDDALLTQLRRALGKQA